jgi:hypothetical protein
VKELSVKHNLNNSNNNNVLGNSNNNNPTSPQIHHLHITDSSNRSTSPFPLRTSIDDVPPDGIFLLLLFKSPSSPFSVAHVFHIKYEDLELGDLLGKGFFGEVRQALWNGTSVAVKVIYRDNFRDRTDLEVFYRELDILSKLRHPNVVLFLGACTQGEHKCLGNHLEIFLLFLLVGTKNFFFFFKKKK